MEHIIGPRPATVLGGKSAGLFLAAGSSAGRRKSFRSARRHQGAKTWYVTSDGADFLDSQQPRGHLQPEVPRRSSRSARSTPIVQVFKNSTFPPEIVKGLSVALDDFGDVPLIVRSSSLLEDRLGAAFSGKYKSLFLANQGDSSRRLEALLDAVAEVYASLFGPDPIEYRAERGLLDFHEEMAVMIQEVVGTRVGRYFLPAYAGVAFSRNEFRWSPRIRREDGLIRLVPGLGTRAVDRIGDDYPVLVSPASRTCGSTCRPTRSSAIRPRRSTSSTSSRQLRDEGHRRAPAEDRPRLPGPRPRSFRSTRTGRDPEAHGPGNGHRQVGRRRDVRRPHLRDAVHAPARGHPQDAVHGARRSGRHRIRLGRARTSTSSSAGRRASGGRRVGRHPARSPADASSSSRQYVSNGRVPDITHIVYVDPDGYAALSDPAVFKRVGQAVGRFNKILPKRQFALMGPGRWGSRGDITLGVHVTYSDINNTAMLIEVARKRGNYVPDLSFGTHFFQDLVEASIRYLPLFPDDPEILKRSSRARPASSPTSRRNSATSRASCGSSTCPGRPAAPSCGSS